MFVLDYLSFTYKPDQGEIISPADFFRRFLNVFPELRDFMEAHTVLSYGKYGYNVVLSSDENFLVMWNSDCLQMGVHVDITSSGLENFARYFDCADPHKPDNALPLLKLLYDRGAAFSRVDVTYDDTKFLITPKCLELAFFESRIVTKYRKHQFYSGADGSTTFYLGNRSGARFLRVYDKSIESNGVNNSIRWEIEYKHKEAHHVVQMLLDHTFDFAAALSDMLRITSDESHGLDNNHRIDSSPQWIELLEELKFNEQNKYLCVPRGVTPLQRSIEYFMHGGPLHMLAVICAALGSDGRALLMDLSWKSLTTKDHDRINHFYSQYSSPDEARNYLRSLVV